ncbi:AAA family ATPase [Desulfocastanea catecholica]
MATLRYGILDNKGFLLLTGDVGTGKTTLINALIGSLSNDVIYASVPDPSLDKLDFFNYIAAAFGIDDEFTSKGKFLASFANFLHKAYENNKKVLLIIDESQLMTQELLEEIRLLSNIVTKDSSPLLNIFFVGQYEFNEIIRRPENRAVAQRLTLNYYIEPLTVEETGAYIQHRLKIAGTTERIFHPSAVKAIYDFSEGFPRRINIICDHCLMSGYAEDQRIITSSIVRDSAKELQIPVRRREKRPERPFPVQQPGPSMSVPPAQPPEPLAQPPEQRREQPRQGAIQVGQPIKSEKTSLSRLTTGILLLLLVMVSLGFFYLYFTETSYKEVLASIHSVQEQIRLRVPQLPGEKEQPEVSGKTVPTDKKKDPVSLPVRDKPPTAPATGSIEKNEQGTPVPVLHPEETGVLQEISKASEKDIHPLPATVTKIPPAIAEEKPAAFVNVEPVSEQKVLQPDFPPESKRPGLPEEPLIIRFKIDSNEFSGADVEKMKEFARIVKLHPEAIINVSGYTDAIGDAAYNLKLSEFRANMVKSFLMGQDLLPEQIRSQGLGNRNPIAGNATAEGRTLNRRVEITVGTDM